MAGARARRGRGAELTTTWGRSSLRRQQSSSVPHGGGSRAPELAAAESGACHGRDKPTRARRNMEPKLTAVAAELAGPRMAAVVGQSARARRVRCRALRSPTARHGGGDFPL
jgi:hypothetical protein